MKAYTQVQDYIRNFSIFNSDKNIAVIRTQSGLQIFSVTESSNKKGQLCLTYETSGQGARFTRKIFEDFKYVENFAVCKVHNTQKIFLALINDKTIYYAISEKPEELSIKDFTTIRPENFLTGDEIASTPSNLLITSSEREQTLFMEFKDKSGRICQYSVILKNKDSKVSSYPLACNFTEIKCNVAGRAANCKVDGVYTFGQYGNEDSLIFTPAYDFYGEGAPSVTRLESDYSIGAISTLKLKNKFGTHLFSIDDENGRLCFYDYEKQLDYEDDTSRSVKTESYSSFKSAKKISSIYFKDKVYVFCLNKSGILSYTFADYDLKKDTIKGIGENDYLPFEEPMPFMSDVVYFGINEDGDLCVCKTNEIIFGKRSESGSWNFEHAEIDSQSGEANKFSAYVTKVNVEKPNANVSVSFPNDNSGCYIDGKYYNAKTIETKADAYGYVSIVQKACDFSPSIFYVSCNNEVISIDAGSEVQKKLLNLTSIEKLNAQKKYTLKDEESNLFDNGNEDGNFVFCNSMTMMPLAMNQMDEKKFPLTESDKKGIFSQLRLNLADKTVCAITDALNIDEDGLGYKIIEDVTYAAFKVAGFIIKGAKKIITLAIRVLDKVKGIFSFIFEIEGKIVEIILKSVKAVFDFVKQLLEKIGIPVDDILDWLKGFLGITDSIKATEAMKKLLQLSSKEISKQCESLDIDSLINQIKGYLPQASSIDSKMIQDNSTSSVNGNGVELSPSITYMYDTIWKNSDDSCFDFDVPISDNVREKLNEISMFIERNENRFADFEKRIYDDFAALSNDIQNLGDSINFADFLNKLTPVFADIAEVGLDLLGELLKIIVTIIAELITIFMESLTKPLNTNISGALRLIAEIFEMFGMEKISIADIVIFPIAFMANTISRITKNGKPLFTENQYNVIMEASSFNEMKCKLLKKNLRTGKKGAEKQNTLIEKENIEICQILKLLEGGFGLVGLVDSFTSLTSTSKKIKVISLFTTSVTTTGIILSIAAGLFYSPMDYDKDGSKYSNALKDLRTHGTVLLALNITKFGLILITTVASTATTYVASATMGKIVTYVENAIMIIINGCTLITKITGLIMSRSVEEHNMDFSEKQIQTDKKLYLCEKIGGICVDTENILKKSIAFAPDSFLLSNPVGMVVISIAGAGNCVLQLGYTTCTFIEISLYEDLVP